MDSGSSFEYVIEEGDTLSGIALQFYGDELLAETLARHNGLDNPDLIRAGQTLKLPRQLFRVESPKRFDEGFGQVAEPKQFGVPIALYAKAVGSHRRVVQRRFVYVWLLEGNTWRDQGLHLTDDFGNPWPWAVLEHQLGVTGEVCDPENLDALDLAKLTALCPMFQLRATYVFMFAPLDMIRATDSPTDEAPSPQSLAATSVPRLVDAGVATKCTIPPGAKRECAPGFLGHHHVHGRRISSVEVELTLNLQERASLLRRQAYYVDKALALDFDAKREHAAFNSEILQLHYLLDLMKSHPRGKDYKKSELVEIDRYQQALVEVSNHVQVEILAKPAPYEVRSHAEDPEGKPWKLTLEEVPDLVSGVGLEVLLQELQDMLAHSDFRAGVFHYLEHLKQNDGSEPAADYFSFKKPAETLIRALHDALLIVSWLPEGEAGQWFYDREWKPLEDAAAAAFDQLSEDDEVVSAVASALKEIDTRTAQLWGLRDANSLLMEPEATTPSKPNRTSCAWANVFYFLTETDFKYLTGFWNNQQGAKSMMTRLLGALARYRNSKLPAGSTTLTLHTARQLKISVVLTRLHTPMGTVEKLRLQKTLVEQTLVNVRHTPGERLYGDALDDLADRTGRAPAAVNLLLSSFQLLVSACGVAKFVMTPDPKWPDYVALADSVSNGALALSGIAPKGWDAIFAAKAAQYGNRITGVAFLCTLYTAAVEAHREHTYGDDAMLALRCVQALVAAAGAFAFFFLTGGGGALIFIGMVAVDVLRGALSALQPGTYKYARQRIEYLDKVQLLRGVHRKEYDGARLLAPQALLHRQRAYHPRELSTPFSLAPRTLITEQGRLIRSRGGTITALYSVQFKSLFASGDRGEALEELWQHRISKIGKLPFAALAAEQTVPLLCARGWLEDAILAVHAAPSDIVPSDVEVVHTGIVSTTGHPNLVVRPRGNEAGPLIAKWKCEKPSARGTTAPARVLWGSRDRAAEHAPSPTETGVS